MSHTVQPHSATVSSVAGTRLIARRVLSVIAGFLAVVILSTLTDSILEATGVLPYGSLYDTGLLLLATAYRSLYTVLGGFVAAAPAPHQPRRHALALGIIGTAAGLLSVVATWDSGLGPHWYPILLTVLALPCTLLGARFASK